VVLLEFTRRRRRERDTPRGTAAPRDIVRSLGGLVLLDQVSDDLSVSKQAMAAVVVVSE